MEECIFCKIIKGEIPSKKLYEDEHVLAFLDIHPESPGHTLIIPKEHHKDMFLIPENELTNIMKSAKVMMNRLEEKLHPDGFRLVQNNGIVQEVKHFHLHIIPVYQEKEEKTVEEIYEIIKK